MTLNNQSFKVGDEVIYIDVRLYITQGVVTRICKINGKTCLVIVTHNGSDTSFTYKGQWLTDKSQVLFHRDAVTFDKHGRLTAINHDYVKECVPKIVTKEPHEFQPFEKVLVRHDTEQTWSCNLFSHIYKTHIYLFQCAAGGAWNECIPYEGNEHLVGKVTE